MSTGKSEHSKPPSCIHSTFLPSCFQPGSNSGSPACLFLEESISERRGMDSRKSFSPTSSGSNTIRFWSPNNTSTYTNSELLDFRISSIRLFFFPQAESGLEPDEIGKMTEEDVDLMRQIKLEVDSDDVQQLLDSHDQELTKLYCS
ncbi:hypothetical protein TNCV_2569811 [Trichonephila clavipes]|nr:hypothetical protein TNCV_2569811 [Trichonephila clavipes]